LNFGDTLFSCNGVLGKSLLLRLKLKAVRAGVWFRNLRQIDRALVDLTLRVTDVVRSRTLLKALVSVAARLFDVLESRVMHAVREIGFPLARRLSLFAQMWGYVSAGSWATDRVFAVFLAVMHINSPEVSRT
jgi:hypothetical protein